MDSSNDLRHWIAAPQPIERVQRSTGLEVVLFKKRYGFPWIHFLFVEGTGEEVCAHFTSHNILVRGTGLHQLISDFTAQCIVSIAQPPRTEKFGRTGACIEEVTVLAVHDEPNDSDPEE